MAVPLTRNAFAEKHPDIFAVFSKRTENVLFSFFLHKTTKRYSFRKIVAVLSIILRLQKRELNFWETIIIITITTIMIMITVTIIIIIIIIFIFIFIFIFITIIIIIIIINNNNNIIIL